MSLIKTYDECYFINYDSCTDLHLYEIGQQACPPGYSFGPIIRNHYIFHYLTSGQGTLYINKNEYYLKAHQGFIIPPNVLAFYKADEINPWSYSWVHLDGPKTNEYFQKVGLNANAPIFIPRVYPNNINQIMQELLKNNKRELFCIGKIFELFDEITSLSSTSSPNNINTQLAYIKKIINFIHVKYSEPIHMDDIAHACGLERSYMTRMFKNATGHTPQEYLMSYRMKKACYMLKNEAISIQNIAYTIGYIDSFTFSKAFKRYAGDSPSNYRENNIKK